MYFILCLLSPKIVGGQFQVRGSGHVNNNGLVKSMERTLGKNANMFNNSKRSMSAIEITKWPLFCYY